MDNVREVTVGECGTVFDPRREHVVRARLQVSERKFCAFVSPSICHETRIKESICRETRIKESICSETLIKAASVSEVFGENAQSRSQSSFITASDGHTDTQQDRFAEWAVFFIVLVFSTLFLWWWFRLIVAGHHVDALLTCLSEPQ